MLSTLLDKMSIFKFSLNTLLSWKLMLAIVGILFLFVIFKIRKSKKITKTKIRIQFIED